MKDTTVSGSKKEKSGLLESHLQSFIKYYNENTGGSWDKLLLHYPWVEGLFRQAFYVGAIALDNSINGLHNTAKERGYPREILDKAVRKLIDDIYNPENHGGDVVIPYPTQQKVQGNTPSIN